MFPEGIVVNKFMTSLWRTGSARGLQDSYRSFGTKYQYENKVMLKKQKKKMLIGVVYMGVCIKL